MKYLCFDISNLLHRTFFVQKDGDEEDVAGMAMHSALLTLNKYFKQFNPDKVVMAFDRPNWRRIYTKSDACLSKREYKGTRRKNMTPSQEEKYRRFLEHLVEFEELITNHTTIITLAAHLLEADDLIAGFVQKYSCANNEIIVISTDSDLLQLLKHTNVSIVSPDTGKPQTLAEFHDDAEYYCFQKCVRGDLRTDNIPSAYPRVRETKLWDAFNDKKTNNDEYKLSVLMQDKWTDEEGTEFVVQDRFDENELLINLEKQPPSIRKLINDTIDAELNRQKKFVLFYFLKFVGKHKLEKIKQSVNQYIPLLSA